MKKIPLAVACSDLHLTLKKPSCRDDRDWMEVQARYLLQLKGIRDAVGEEYNLNMDTSGTVLPVICAGDIFDRWNPVPELINFALENLPDGMICVPGQHDLPNHRQDQMHRSGYGVLKQANKIIDVSGGPKTFYPFPGMIVDGYGWGSEIQPCAHKEDGSMLHVAVIHKYVWIQGASYGRAPEEDRAFNALKKLNGYDVAIFGDNHCHFSGTYKKMSMMNPGGFIRRRFDEMGHQPSVGIIYDDGTVERRKLDTSSDKFRDPKVVSEAEEADIREFVEQLEKLGDHGLDFRGTVRRHLESADDVPEPVKSLVLKALEDA